MTLTKREANVIKEIFQSNIQFGLQNQDKNFQIESYAKKVIYIVVGIRSQTPRAVSVSLGISPDLSCLDQWILLYSQPTYSSCRNK